MCKDDKQFFAVNLETNENVSEIKDLVKQVLAEVKPKPQKKHIKQPDRDPVSFSIFQLI